MACWRSLLVVEKTVFFLCFHVNLLGFAVIKGKEQQQKNLETGIYN